MFLLDFEKILFQPLQFACVFTGIPFLI